MSKPTVSADGGALPAQGQQPGPMTERERSSILLDVDDELVDVRNLIEAAWMAAAKLVKEECDPMQTVLCMASEKLAAARQRLDTARPQPKEPANG
ncbi:MAG: hypothetical protein ABSC25_24380 [Roseiarcus sp.]|jgi:hypothetical protein